ncbi:hypothetical protein CEXT_510761 [Caerostris extrusa]|uniref:Uncharacterized protein n=1 Tax=Caerostris extrusa TaxID=172846 RepID=A0AAV4WMY5_CAEEX|nr:hypothetical protein CEXT_510761 [Caerostris extrusa]
MYGYGQEKSFSDKTQPPGRAPPFYLTPPPSCDCPLLFSPFRPSRCHRSNVIPSEIRSDQIRSPRRFDVARDNISGQCERTLEIEVHVPTSLAVYQYAESHQFI